MGQISIELRDRELTTVLSQWRLLVTLRRERLVDKSGLKRKKKAIKGEKNVSLDSLFKTFALKGTCESDCH